MLILTRRAGERVVIGDGIEISVLSIKGNQVRLGINAPKGVSVFRQELLDRANAEAASTKIAEKQSSGA